MAGPTLALMFLGVMSACGGSVPQPEHEASATTAASSTSLEKLLVDTIAEVVVTDPPITSASGLGPDPTILLESLATGDRVFVVDGPVAKDGYEWYKVATLPPVSLGLLWLAVASSEGEVWVRPVEPECPEIGVPLTIDEIAELGAHGALTCYGGQELTVVGWVAPTGGSGGCTGQDPIWLTCGNGHLRLASAKQMVDGTFRTDAPGAAQWWVAYPPENPILSALARQPDRLVEVAGHFDDPAAALCGEPDPVRQPALSGDPAQFVLACRLSFVGTDGTIVE